jgi:hypothetical protein
MVCIEVEHLPEAMEGQDSEDRNEQSDAQANSIHRTPHHSSAPTAKTSY